MPRPKIHESDSARAQAHRNANFDRMTLDIRKDAPVNRETIKRAAKASGAPTAAFIMQAVSKYILDTLGPEWLEENQNKGAGENGEG